MKLKQNKTQVYLLLIFSLALLIGVGYAALSATLKINGQTTINKASWDVHMENINVTSGSVTATAAPTLDTAKTTVNFSVKLTNPGDFYEFTVKEVNKGTIDAMVSTISKTGLTTTQAKYLDYTVTYGDGVALAEKQLLKSNQSETLKVRISFKTDLTAADLPTEDITLNLNLSLSYQQADDNAVAIVHPVCKRATTLHTEVCNQTNSSIYCSGAGYTIGATVTYGNLGTTGVLTSGDAFDCDVNGDGMYDPITERFYYVSGKDGDNNSDYVTLIYYNNVSNGVPNNTTSYVWISKVDYVAAGGTEANYGTYGNNSKGPLTAIKQLPTTKQWNNVSLSSTKIDITDEKGILKVTDFSYVGYAARLLTVQEVNYACGITAGSLTKGELDSCQYLMENTLYTKYANSSSKYGYWLESPYSSSMNSVWNVSGESYVNKSPVAVSNLYGIRPAIEVLKSKISY